MKRTFQESSELDHTLNMANCLMFFSQGRVFDAVNGDNMRSATRVFQCKTCNKQFTSFQALGGHRTSHKKLRLKEGNNNNGGDDKNTPWPMKAKTHECSVCGLEFAEGQALGGHMRRHKTSSLNGNENVSDLSLSDTAPLANSRRVLSLDLNLTPYENGLAFYRETDDKFVDLKNPKTHWLICL